MKGEGIQDLINVKKKKNKKENQKFLSLKIDFPLQLIFYIPVI